MLPKTYTNITNHHITSICNLQVKQIFQFSDGYNAQYKSKGPFMDISMGLMTSNDWV